MRKSAFRSNRKVFHITLNCEPSSKRGRRWRELQRIINPLLSLCDTEIHALVMMDTHVHLLTSNFSNSENFFSASLQNLLAHGVPHENLAEPVLNFTQYLNTYRYIYRNPVEAGVSSRVETYPFSSLAAILGRGSLQVNVSDHLGLIQHPQRVLKWLNSGGDYKASRISWMREKSA